MTDPNADEFDPNDRIAGFSLLSIKRALTMVGIMEDRDDIAHVARELSCPPAQALRVLEELERRGLVTKGKKKRQWNTTQKGHQLVWYWHPPRILRPAIEYDAEPGSINRQCAAVACSILRYTQDEEEMFEEGELDVGIHVDYDTDRLIEINISQLDEYQGESNGAAVCELSVYISPAEAKAFVAGLHEAIERAEREAAQRATKRAREGKREERRSARGLAKKRATQKPGEPAKRNETPTGTNDMSVAGTSAQAERSRGTTARASRKAATKTPRTPDN
jgi:hypothetical protein